MLVVRIWTEEGPSDWRARITWSINDGEGSQAAGYASNSAEIHAAVSDWLTTFVRAGRPREE